MKLKVLAACVMAATLAGCGDSDPKPQPNDFTLQAYDGAIWGIEGDYECTGERSGKIPKTDATGYVTIPLDNPEECAFTFKMTPGAKDVSNDKDMSKVSYKIAKGMVFEGSTKAAATPLSTLITETLVEEGAEYSEATATEVLEALGLDELLNDGGLTITDLVEDFSGSIKKIKDEPSLKALHSKVIATTVILSDIITAKAQGDAELDLDQLANIAKNVAAIIVKEHPDFPAKTGDATKVVVYKYEDVTKLVIDNKVELVKELGEGEAPEIVLPTPVIVTPGNPDPTGGTGGTGGTGATGGTGGGSGV